MSARCTAAVFDRYPAGGGEFALALALADNAHQDGTHIFISIQAMAAKSRQSVRAVQMHLRGMLASGWLVVTRQGGGRGRYAEYRICPKWLNGADIAPFTPAPGNPQDGTKGADFAPFPNTERVQNDARKGAKRRTPYITERTLIPPTPLGGGASPDTNPTENPASAEFAAIAAEYPRRARLDLALLAWIGLAMEPGTLPDVLAGLRRWKASAEWQRDQGRWVPRLDKWLVNRRWLDAPGVGPASPAVLPLPPALPELTPEQRAANKARAQQLAQATRQAIAQRRVQPEAATC